MARQAALAPKRSLGQNFLIDGNIAENIVRAVDPRPDDAIVEIGAGRGALTGKLAARAGHLLVVEIDRRAIGALRASFEGPSVVILQADFLDVDLPAWSAERKRKLRLVGNLPYHLTSPILFKAFDDAAAIRDLTIMVQREVADRIAASPGSKSYGILAVLTRFYGTARRLFTVSPNCFSPRPKVTSAVVHVAFDAGRRAGVDERLFRTVVKTTFGKRRKTLRNSLAYLPYDEETVGRIAQGLTFPLEKRPEQLTLEEFLELTTQIERFIG